jgi:small-conductance mechanosensitive channel
MNLPGPEQLLNWPVGFYIGGVVLGQVVLILVRRMKQKRLKDRRREVHLNDDVLVDHSLKLKTIRRQGMTDASVLLVTLVFLPIVLASIYKEQAVALGLTFFVLLAWVLVTATDVAKAFLGGVAFRAFVGVRRPFQVGDRVTLSGYSGKVEEIGPFFIRMTTLDDDLVSIPTASLWNTPIVSANAGDKASLCVMTFHLAPFIKAEARKAAEQAIWDAIQRSVYWDFEKPMQIYLEQRKDEILLTARAYVASTYNEPLFKSDVCQAFLDFADKESLPLASLEWRRPVKPEKTN